MVRSSSTIGLDHLDERDPERERLARSGRGLDERVAAGEHVGDDGPLDREGGGYAALLQRVRDRFRHAEIGE